MTVNAVTNSISSRLYSGAKYLDQPWLIENLYKASPLALGGLGLGYTAYATAAAKSDHREKAFVRTALVSTGAIAAALLATKYLGERPQNVAESMGEGVQLVRHVLENKTLSKEMHHLLDEAKTTVLSPIKVHQLYKELGKVAPGAHKALLNAIIPSPQSPLKKAEEENLIHSLKKLNPKLSQETIAKFIPEHEKETFKEFAKELLELTGLGLAPITGGIIGGAAANAINGENWRHHLKNQMKEGSYQLLSNIALCNVGAAAFGGLLNVFHKDASRAVKLGVMLAGIGTIGVWAGSAIANAMGKIFINSACEHGPRYAFHEAHQRYKKEGIKGLLNNLYEDRHAEVLDVATHVDDLATIGALAGLKWIFPGLAFLYSFCGIRAGIGYRNGHHEAANDNKLEHGHHGQHHGFQGVNNPIDNAVSPLKNTKKASENLAAFSNSSIQNPYATAAYRPQTYNPFMENPAALVAM